MNRPAYFTFDPAKDALNRRHHHIGLDRVENGFDFASAFLTFDDREDYGELRELALGFIGEALYVLVFTMREDDTCHSISLRKAERKEVRIYVENI